jgi:hypothetical protein
MYSDSAGLRDSSSAGLRDSSSAGLRDSSSAGLKNPSKSSKPELPNYPIGLRTVTTLKFPQNPHSSIAISLITLKTLSTPIILINHISLIK